MAYSGFPIHFLDCRQRPVCGMLGKLTDGFYTVRFAKGSIDLSEATVVRVLQANQEQLTVLTQASGLAQYLVTSSTGELKESFIPMKTKVQSRVFGGDFITGYAAFLTGLPGPLAVMVNVSAERRVNVEGSFLLPDMRHFIRDFATVSSVAAQRHGTKDYIQVPMITAERGLIAGLVDNYKKLLPHPNNVLPSQLFMFGGAQVYEGPEPATPLRVPAAAPRDYTGGQHVAFRDLSEAPADWRDCVARTSGPIEDPPEIVRISKAPGRAPAVSDIAARFAPARACSTSDVRATSDSVARAPEACMFLQRGWVEGALPARNLLPPAFAAVLQGTWLNTPEEQRYRASTVFGIEERLRSPFGQNLLKCLPPESHSSIAETIYVRTNGCCVTDDMIGSIVSGLVNDAKCERLAKGLKRAHEAALQADAELDSLLERAGQFSAMGVVGDQVRAIAASSTGMASKAARIEARWQAPVGSDCVARLEAALPPWRQDQAPAALVQALQAAEARWPSVARAKGTSDCVALTYGASVLDARAKGTGVLDARALRAAPAALATEAPAGLAARVPAALASRAPRRDYAEEKDSEDETEEDDLYS